VIELRGRNWEGLPPPPVFTIGKLKLAHTNEKDSSATPVVTSLRLPNGDLEPQVAQPPPLGPVTTPDTDTFSGSPATQSPSISIASLSEFTVADISDGDEPPPVSTQSPAVSIASLSEFTVADTSDGDEPPPVYPTTVVRDETFYLEDGNVEVLCGSTLFRVNTSVLSFHSPALRRMFAQTSLALAGSPNGCPRILSADTATDFAILLKTVYLPG
jgi:hypothetical protein